MSLNALRLVQSNLSWLFIFNLKVWFVEPWLTLNNLDMSYRQCLSTPFISVPVPVLLFHILFFKSSTVIKKHMRNDKNMFIRTNSYMAWCLTTLNKLLSKGKVPRFPTKAVQLLRKITSLTRCLRRLNVLFHIMFCVFCKSFFSS